MLIWGLRVACRLRLPCFLAWVGARLAKPLPGSQEEDLLSVTGPRGSGDSVPMATAGGPLHGQPGSSLDSASTFSLAEPGSLA